MQADNLDVFLPYYANIRTRTRRVIDCIPPDRMEWTHQEGKFTFGDIIRHLAGTERFMFAENVHGRPSRYPGHTADVAGDYPGPVAYMDALHRESMDLFGQLTAEQLHGKCEPPAGIQMTTWKWLRSMVEHECHHRGQIYLMLGMLGVDTPPLYGMTAEQVQERSVT